MIILSVPVRFMDLGRPGMTEEPRVTGYGHVCISQPADAAGIE